MTSNNIDNEVNTYTKLDLLMQRYDISKLNYDMLMDDIYQLWDEVMKPHIEEYSIKRWKLNMSQFYDFILNKSPVAKLVVKEYQLSEKLLNNYVNKNNIINENFNYLQDVYYDFFEELENEHIDMLKEVHGENWKKIYDSTIKPLYNEL